MRSSTSSYVGLIVTALLSTFMGTGLFALMAKHSALNSPIPELASLCFALVLFVVTARYLALLRTGSQEFVNARSRWMRVLVLFSILLKVLYLDLPDLVPEEAYYWVYAQHPALAYLDHPPLVAWGILAGTTVFGNSEFGVRIFTLLCWLVMLWFLSGLASNLHGKRTRLPVLMLGCLLPYPFLFGFFATPDAPLMAAWAGALFFIERAYMGKSRAAWLGFGLCTGLGMLSKYSFALLGPSLIFVLLLDRNNRRWLARPEPYLATLLAFLVFSPVVIWNQQNDWVSFTFQSSRRLAERSQFRLPQLLLFVLALLTPIGIAAILEAIRKPLDWAAPRDTTTGIVRRRRLLILMAVTLPLTVFVVFSISHRTKMSWTGPIWLALLPVLGAQIAYAPDKALLGLRWLRPRLWLPMAALLALFYGGMMQYMSIGLPWIPYPSHTVKPVAWQEMGQVLDRMLNDLGVEECREPLLVGIDRHFITSEVSFYRGGTEKAMRTTRTERVYGGNGTMYQYWFPQRPASGSVLLIVSFEKDQIQDERIAKHLEELGPVLERKIEKRGKPAGRFFYRIGKGYDPTGSQNQ